MADLSKIEEHFNEHYSFLCAAAYNVVEDEEVAKDIVQNFFMYCLDKISTIAVHTSFKSYAFRAVRNASLSYRKRAQKVDYNNELMLRASANMASYQERDTQEREAIRDRALWEIIEQMPERRKHIFLLSNKDGLKYTEIAAQLDISVNTVKTHIKLSYEFLRRECQQLIRMIILIVIWFGFR
ncbi:sigma-70 family RNA polymerase sigma factor [Pedobacter rhizosphaerae]|uniref:RNA polymerase sigma-70 factor, ECF subfamily n=1 Tax=Pedobacter rhizosphaerae TaxID=390241 RepID=A0A1H9KRB8_9SPHI|nr:sigma-70 family RNA polymerase sigma factor [Pedobacter rhizosphaerae]SER01700.1 RNA polymerase sigma-70 factor, ECF subfamily [Pedobacter rhizosphaerae]